MTNSELLKNLAAEARAINAKDSQETKPADEQEFCLTLVEYPDLIITKKMTRGMRHLIVMPSAGVIFFKTEKPGKDAETEPFSADAYSKFSGGMPDIPLPEGFWTKKITRGVATGRQLAKVFANSTILEMIRKKALLASFDFLESKEQSHTISYEDGVKAFQLIPQLYMENLESKKNIALILRCPYFIKDIQDMFGLNNARDFLQNYEMSLIKTVKTTGYGTYDTLTRSARQLGSYENTELIGRDIVRTDYAPYPYITMEYARFMEYTLYDSVRMGYGMNWKSFFNEWRDTLQMEYDIYGKITKKYPTNLPLLHNQLSYKSILMQQEIDEKKFDLQCKKASIYEGEYKDFAFIAPKCKQDFFDEATMQSNCLAGYIDHFTEGDCIILFMRKKNQKDVSHITVEIIDGIITQAKLARNMPPSQTDLAILKEWVRKCNSKVA